LNAVRNPSDQTKLFPGKYADHILPSTDSTSDWSWPFRPDQILPFDGNPEYPGQQPESKWLAAGPEGVIWIAGQKEAYHNAKGAFLDMNDVQQEHSLSLPTVLGWQRQSSEAQHYTVDSQGRLWFYQRGIGLKVIDGRQTQNLGVIPGLARGEDLGGVLMRRDGTVWTSTPGWIWEWDGGQWQKHYVPREDQVFTHFVETGSGEIYAASGEGVYRFRDQTFEETSFVHQGYKPVVVPEGGKLLQAGECSFHKRYAEAANCPMWWGSMDPARQYRALYLGVLKDGSVIYVNNRVVAKLQDNRWRGFAFDTFEIDSATVDKDGNIWIFSRTEGLIRLAVNIFDEYQELVK
jgi:hypothetical protein